MEVHIVRSEIEETFRTKQSISGLDESKKVVKDLMEKVEFLQGIARNEKDVKKGAPLESSILMAKAGINYLMERISKEENREYNLKQAQIDLENTREENRKKIEKINTEKQLGKLTFAKPAPVEDPKPQPAPQPKIDQPIVASIEEAEARVAAKKPRGRPKKDQVAA